MPELNEFTWNWYDDEDFWFKNLHHLDQQEISEFLKTGFIEDEIVIDGIIETRFSKKVGNVWIGRKSYSL